MTDAADSGKVNDTTGIYKTQRALLKPVNQIPSKITPAVKRNKILYADIQTPPFIGFYFYTNKPLTNLLILSETILESVAFYSTEK